MPVILLGGLPKVAYRGYYLCLSFFLLRHLDQVGADLPQFGCSPKQIRVSMGLISDPDKGGVVSGQRANKEEQTDSTGFPFKGQVF